MVNVDNSKKIEKLLRLKDDPYIALTEHLIELEEQIEQTKAQLAQQMLQNSELNQTNKEDLHQSLTSLLANIQSAIDSIKIPTPHDYSKQFADIKKELQKEQEIDITVEIV